MAAACLEGLRRRPGSTVGLPVRAPSPEPGARPPPGAAQALAGLPVDLRTALVLIDVAGLPPDDAGTVLGLPRAAVRRRCAQGRTRLAQALGELPMQDAGTGRGHLDLARLGDVLLGDEPPVGRPARPRAARHLAECGRCSSALLDLQRAQAAVSDALARLPVPPAPPTLGPGVDAALRAGVRPHPGATDPGATDPGATSPGATSPGATNSAGRPAGGVRAPTGSRVVDPRRRRRPRARLRLAATAAVTAVLVAVALLVLPGGHAPRPGTGPVPRRPAPARGVPTSSTGTDYLGGQALVAAVLPALLRGSVGPAPPSGGAPPQPMQTGPTASPSPSLSRLRDPDELAGCLSGLSDPSSDSGPLALDYARYDGVPALLVVLPSSAAGRADVYVVGTDCRTGVADTLLFAQLLLPS